MRHSVNVTERHFIANCHLLDSLAWAGPDMYDDLDGITTNSLLSNGLVSDSICFVAQVEQLGQTVRLPFRLT